MKGGDQWKEIKKYEKIQRGDQWTWKTGGVKANARPASTDF